MRKNIIFYFLSIIILSSCSKQFDDWFVHVDGKAREIQGKWQLVGTDTVFYNFQNNLFEYQIYLEKDSIFCAYGYYTLHGDSGIYLELTSNMCFMNYDKLNYTHSIDSIVGWDKKNSASGSGADTLYRYFKMEGPIDDRLKLTYQTDEYLFQKF